MNISKVGNIITKTNVLNTVDKTVPKSRTRDLPNGAWSDYHSGGTIVTNSGSSTIIYTNKPKGQKTRTANLCRHFTTALNYSGNTTVPWTILNTQPGHPPIEYEHYALHIDSKASHSTALGTAITALGVPLNQQYLATNGLGLLNAAFVKTKPNLTTISLPNILIEIGQIRMLWFKWKRYLSIAKNVAGGFLTYKFGWKPAMGDLYELTQTVINLRQRLRAFNNAAGGVLHFQEQVLKDTITKSGSFSAGYASRRCEWRASVSRVATAHFAFRIMPIADVDALYNTLGAFLDAVGVELNPRILWDAIPFSFVVDWFVDVGSYLERFSIDTFELPVVLVDSYLQYKEGLVIESSLIDGYGLVGQTMVRSGGWHTAETYFQRMPLYPDFLTLQGLGFRMPTFGQAVLGLALGTVLARTKR